MRDTALSITILLGKEDELWEYIETDPGWWQLHLAFHYN